MIQPSGGCALSGDMLYQVTAPHFCAGFTAAHDGAITSAAPIIRWMFNHNVSYIRNYCAQKKWSLEIVPP